MSENFSYMLAETQCDLKSAMKYSKIGKIEDWVHHYCNCGSWANEGLSKGLRLQKRWWNGPLRLPMICFDRKVGPEGNLDFQVDQTCWTRRINSIANSFTGLTNLPPLIAEYRGGRLSLADGNHRFAAMELLGIDTCWAVIWYNTLEDYAMHLRFLEAQYHK